MGFFENMRIESELKEQRDIFIELHKNEIEQFRQETHTLQEIEENHRQFEIEFRQWFIDNYIFPKYFTNRQVSTF